MSMSKKLFKKLYLAFSIILACSFIPSMMMCYAQTIVENLGTIEVDGKNEVCFNPLCGEMYGVKTHPKFYSDTAKAIIDPSNNTSEYVVAIKYKDSTSLHMPLKGSSSINFSTENFPDPIVCVSMMDEGIKNTFEGSIDTNSNQFTCTSFAYSLIAPIGAMIATILGLLAL